MGAEVVNFPGGAIGEEINAIKDGTGEPSARFSAVLRGGIVTVTVEDKIARTAHVMVFRPELARSFAAMVDRIARAGLVRE